MSLPRYVLCFSRALLPLLVPFEARERLVAVPTHVGHGQ